MCMSFNEWMYLASAFAAGQVVVALLVMVILTLLCTQDWFVRFICKWSLKVEKTLEEVIEDDEDE